MLRRLASFSRGVIAASLLLIAIGVAVVALRPNPTLTTPTQTSVGSLPERLQPSDLNLLLITLDTTRADRLGAYGWPNRVTPTLDRIAREGVLFERAVAAAPLTLPAHTSIFTAKYPAEHGVRDNGGFFLKEAETTLAERLRGRNFKTGGFVGAYVLDRKWGIAQGFDTYFDDFDLSKYKSAALGDVERPGNEVADRALAWLQTVADSQFFGWLHFYDPHSPYSPPEPYRTRFAQRPYVGEIAFVDSQVTRIIEFLDQRQLLKKTIVAVIGDHGESLGEHNESTHGFFVYEPVLRVPMMIWSPYDALRGRRVADVVRSVDLVPTLLDLLGIALSDKVEGRSLVSLMTGATRELGLPAYSESVYPRLHYGWSDLQALRAGRYKYIDAPRPELYDLDQDPGETRNLVDERQPLAARMAAEIRSVGRTDEREIKPVVDVDPDTRARLAALGYIGTFASSNVTGESALADPKDKIDLFNLLSEARESLRDGRAVDRALKSLQDVVSRDPKVIDAWLMLGNEYVRRRQFTMALQQYKHALALKPDYDLVVINMANTYRMLGRDDHALVGYRRLIELDPDNPQVRYEIAQILADHGQLDEAARELTIALTIEPGMAAARSSLGAVRLKQGDVAAGERDIRAALQIKPDLRLAHFNLALAAEKRGDLTSAALEYKNEIALHPDSYMAEFNLGKLYERSGDRQAQIDAYRRAIAANPEFAEGHLFLAKLYSDVGEHDEEAVSLARRGIELAPRGEFAPLGHFVIADIYSRRGQRRAAEREIVEGRRLDAMVKSVGR